uniref:BOS complex subunit TMEM147 n=1 Tax=Globodera rostochiensis TaxID=31243 RepID=A0A914HVW6_GLORO
MTFFHFCNCVVLAYAPHFIVFRYSSLSEYTSIWKCGQAAIVYLMTQFIKMLTLATFFPIVEGEYSFSYELMKSAVDIIDVMGLHFAISYFLSGKGEVRMFTAGLGWTAAHSILTYFVVFFVGARTSGFSWRFIQTAIKSNLDLVFHLSLASLVWIFNRIEQTARSKHLACVLLLFCIFHSAIYQTIFNYLAIDSWQMIGIETLFTVGLALSTLIAYSGVVAKE